MFNPDGSHNQLATRSWVDEVATTTLTPLDLPPELILRIASLLEVRDLLAFRGSHRSIYSVSQDRLLWRGLLRDLRPPVPRALRSRGPENLSYSELEKIVLDSCRVERRWLKRREPGLLLFAMEEGSSIRLLDFLDDRWIVSIPSNGPPIIWDTHKNTPSLCVPMSHSYETLDAAVAVDPLQGDVVIVLRGEYELRMLRMRSTEPEGDPLQLTDYGTIGDPDLGEFSLEPSRSAVISGFIGVGIEIRDWTCNRSVTVSTTGANDDDDQEPILGLRLVGDYILCFTPRWIGLFYVPPFSGVDEGLVSEHECTSQIFLLKYQELVFQGASLSEPQPNPESPDSSRIIYILAYHTTVGFFYFRVTIYDPDYTPSGPRARMDVDLVGVYELDKPQEGVRGMSGPRLVLGAWLGPEGKRGIWIERPLNEVKRFVVAVSFDRSCSAVVPVELGDDLQELCEIAPQIESTADIFVVESWNPNDDIVRCAFSESTGKIVLRTRDSRIILLR